MLGDRGWPVSFIEGTLEAYGRAIDIAKISVRHIHQSSSSPQGRWMCS
jgi:hypothetical protein